MNWGGNLKVFRFVKSWLFFKMAWFVHSEFLIIDHRGCVYSSGVCLLGGHSSLVISAIHWTFVKPNSHQWMVSGDGDRMDSWWGHSALCCGNTCFNPCWSSNVLAIRWGSKKERMSLFFIPTVVYCSWGDGCGNGLRVEILYCLSKIPRYKTIYLQTNPTTLSVAHPDPGDQEET